MTPHVVAGISALTHVERGGEKFVQGSGKQPYVLKRHADDAYSCSCPAWRMQPGAPPDGRSCKHLQELLGSDFERARVEAAGGVFKEAGKAKPKKKAAAAPTQLSAPSVAPAASGSKRKADDDAEDPKKKPKVAGKTAKATKKQPRSRTNPSPSPAEELDAAMTAVGAAPKEEDEDDNVPSLMLALKWNIDGSGVDPKGYWMSEKLDGVRGYWQASKGTIVSRAGNVFKAPQWFTDKFPKDLDLDGELYLARGAFSEVNGIVKSHNSSRWTEIVFKAFDVPSSSLPFEDRLALLQTRFGGADGTVLEGGENKHFIHGNAAGNKSEANSRDDGVIEVVPHVLCEGQEHVMSTLKEVVDLEGEGLMLRKPKTVYKGTRTTDLLKVKTFFDAEARVTGYEDGKGKHKGVTGSLQCVMQSGKTFKVGSGLTDAQRKKPPAVGSIVRCRFFELSKDGIPRFPTFVGEAVDKTGPKDAEVPEKRVLGSKVAAEKGDD